MYALKVAYIYVYIIVCNISIGVYIIVQTYAYIDSIYSIYSRDRDVPTKWYIPVPVSLSRGVKGRPSLNSTPCRWGSLTTLHPRYSALRPHLLRRIGRHTAVGSAARTPGLCRACRASPAPARRPPPPAPMPITGIATAWATYP